jgi:hypothetical protein
MSQSPLFSPIQIMRIMRRPCPDCGNVTGYGEQRGPHVSMFCAKCDRWQFHETQHKERNMAFTHNVNSGSLFKNEYRTKDSAPHWKGSANWEGQVFEIAAWLQEGKNGQKYFRLKLQPPYERPSRNATVEIEEEDPFA